MRPKRFEYPPNYSAQRRASFQEKEKEGKGRFDSFFEQKV